MNQIIYNPKLKYLIFFVFVILFSISLKSQITIENYVALSNPQVANALVDSLMGNGVTFSNASFQGVRSSSSSYGYQTCFFTTTGTTLTQMGVAKGVALTSGNTNLISIPMGQNPAASNSFSKGYISSTPGELRKSTSPINDLTVLAGPVNWYNAAILEFDFVPSGDSIEFNYVFGSEEYSDNTNFTNYQCTEYNDKFGFLISGPGIAGNAGYDNNARNIARLTNGSEVGINSVNNGTVGSSASPNGPSYCQNTNPAWTLNTPVNEYYGPIQGTSPNGNTKVLKAVQGGLTPGATYHIRLLILDAKDGAYDAIVYIEAGSFTSPQPGLTLTANPSSLCQGASTFVVANQSNGTAPFNYTWSNSVVHNTSATADSILVSPSVTTTYSVTVTDSQSQTASASIVITVNPNPSPVAGSNSPVCQGNNLNLTVNTGTSWSWSGPNGFTSTSQNPIITPATPAAGGTYSVTVTNAQACSASTSVTATVNPLPTPVAGSNSPICQGSNLNLNVNTGTSWTWSGPNGFTSTSQNPVITAATPAASGTYTVNVTNAQGCSAGTTVTATVNSLPVPVAGSNSPVCQGNNLNLNVNTGTSWSWSGPNGFTSTSQNPVITAATPAAGGTYTVTVTNAQACSASTTVTATVNSLPTPIAGSNSPICQGSNLNLNVNTGTSWSWSGPNGFTSTSQNPIITAATTAASGTYTVAVTNVQGCSASTTVQVIVNTYLTPAASSNSPVCVGGNLNLSVNTGTTWNWTGPNGFSSTQQNPVISNVTTAATGTYTVQISNAQGCTGTATVNAVINANPQPLAGSNSPVCQNNTLSLNVNTGISWNWSGPNGFSSTTQNPSISNATPAAGGTYTVTVSNAQGCTASTSVQTTVNLAPVLNPITNSPICQNATLSLGVNSGISFNWTGPNGFSSTVQNPSLTLATPAASGTYAVTVSDAQGCTASASVNATVNANPLPVCNSNAPLCESNTLNLTVNTGTSWNWTGPNSFTSTLQNPYVNNITLASNGAYTVTVTDAQGCSGTATVNVLVNANPQPLAGSNSPVCQNNTLSLNVNAGTSWNWSGPSGFSSTTQNPSIPNATTLATGTYTVTVTDVNACSGTASVNVNINQAPVLTVTSSPSGVCYGNQATLSVTGATSYIWSTGDTATSFTDTPLSNTTYTVTGTDNQGCNTVSQTSVTVNPLPVISISPSQPAVCEGSPVTLTAVSNTTATQFEWNNAATGASITVSPATNTTYSVIVTDANGCTGQASTAVTVNPIPSVDFDADPLNGCAPLNVSFSSLSSSQNTHQWTFGDNSSASLINPGHLYLNAGMYSVTLTVTSTAGCSNSLTKSNFIEVYPVPIASFYTNSSLTDMLESEISFTNQSSGAVSWEWDFGDGSDSSSTEENPVFTYSQDGNFTVWLYVESLHGCTDSTSRDVIIKPLTTFYVPNAFTPNGDGMNDFFSPMGVGIDLDDYEMYIYDRWGKLVFMTNDINHGWDGTVKDSGNKAGQDVYSWVIFLTKPKNSERHLYRHIGSVTLLR